MIAYFYEEIKAFNANLTGEQIDDIEINDL